MSTKRRKKQTLTAAEMLRSIKVAQAAGLEELAVIPTADGIKAVFVLKPRGGTKQDEEDQTLEGLE